MKTLATCKPTEFLTQTNRIRKHAEEWLKKTGIMEIRRTLPTPKPIPADASLSEKEQIIAENKKLLNEQATKNMSKIFDAALEQYPKETLEMIALCCFIEPDDIDSHEVSEYLNAIAELIGNTAVLNFFTSLVQLGQMITSGAPNQ